LADGGGENEKGLSIACGRLPAQLLAGATRSIAYGGPPARLNFLVQDLSGPGAFGMGFRLHGWAVFFLLVFPVSRAPVATLAATFLVVLHGNGAFRIVAPADLLLVLLELIQGLLRMHTLLNLGVALLRSSETPYSGRTGNENREAQVHGHLLHQIFLDQKVFQLVTAQVLVKHAHKILLQRRHIVLIG
jgi:hypothetical protein